jgi:serine/threonine-protein kinase
VISAFVDGTLGLEAVRRIDEHVARCGSCRTVIAALSETDDASASKAAMTVEDVIPDPGALRLAELVATGRIGQTIDDTWRLVRLLGTGGMGQVFEAVASDGRRVALKLLRPELAAHPEIVRRFVRERTASRRIDHRAFVPIIADGTTAEGAPYLVMELVDGQTLRATVKRDGPLPEARVRQIGAELLEAIAAAHAAGVLHRDVKPDNVAIDRDGALRILDFGIARISAGDDDASTTVSATVTGQMLGTPAYMPPEQARAIPSQIDERADVFATAATLVFLLTGKAARPATGTLFEAMTQPVPSVRTLAPEVSPALARVLDRALSFDKGDRFPSALAMRDALLGAPDVRSRARPIFAGAVALAASAMAITAWFAWQRPAPPAAPPPREEAQAITAITGVITPESDTNTGAVSAAASAPSSRPPNVPGPRGPQRARPPRHRTDPLEKRQ